MAADTIHSLLALDFESVIVPEIWPALAEKLAIVELTQTTRDTGDVASLMDMRIDVCRQRSIRVAELQRLVAEIEPLPGAKHFLDGARSQLPVVLVSDVCFELAAPLLEKLGAPTLLCHHLQVDEAGVPFAYRPRKPVGKGAVVRAFQQLDYHVLAIGDSFNDIDMLSQANRALLLNPPLTLVARYPHLTVVDSLVAAARIFGIELSTLRDDHGAARGR